MTWFIRAWHDSFWGISAFNPKKCFHVTCVVDSRTHVLFLLLELDYRDDLKRLGRGRGTHEWVVWIYDMCAYRVYVPILMKQSCQFIEHVYMHIYIYVHTHACSLWAPKYMSVYIAHRISAHIYVHICICTYIYDEHALSTHVHQYIYTYPHI